MGNLNHSLWSRTILQVETKCETRRCSSKVVNSHNVAPSRRNPQLEDGMHASPYEVINDLDLVDHMEQTLKEHHLQQYSMNIEKKLIKLAP